LEGNFCIFLKKRGVENVKLEKIGKIFGARFGKSCIFATIFWSFFSGFCKIWMVFCEKHAGNLRKWVDFWLSKWRDFHICALWDLKMIAANLKKIFAANEREFSLMRKKETEVRRQETEVRSQEKMKKRNSIYHEGHRETRRAV